MASIRPSAEPVKFEHDGETKMEPGVVRMRDVTIETCIKWAYRVQRSQVSGPGLLTSERYDIVAKSDAPASDEQMRLMMRVLLTERFNLAFHTEKKELRSFALIVTKGGTKLKQATPDEVPYRQNSAMGTTARATTMIASSRLAADCTSISILTRWLSGIASVGLNAVAFVYDR